MGRIDFCNVGCGDCTVIQDISCTFLVDCYGIEKYKYLLPVSRKLRGVFITHQHTDHFAGLRYLLNHGYTIDYLIFSPYKRRPGDASVTLAEWNEFARLRDSFVAKGSETRTPFRQSSFEKPFWEVGNVRFEIIAPFQDLAQRTTREIHDACLVIGVYAGSRRFLICGDASDSSLSRIARNTNNYCNDVLRCSHHGSDYNADLEFLIAANARYTVVSTQKGVFPSMPGSIAMARYRRHTRVKVYRTDVDGTWGWDF